MLKIRTNLIHMFMALTLTSVQSFNSYAMSTHYDNTEVEEQSLLEYQDSVQNIERAPSSFNSRQIDLSKFDKPFCMIGRGKHKLSFRNKLRTLKRYQKKISRRRKDFRKNRRSETKAALHGSPKWIVIKYLRKRGFNWDEIDFAFFSMTLFGEARNLKPHDIEMVARAINNRRKGRTYRQTVTHLAQFSTWYYKNQRDNVNLLCPHPAHFKNWRKVVLSAIKQFYRTDKTLGSSHYFAPHNMVPKYRLPSWAKGKYGARFGGHIFVFNNKKEAKVPDEKLFFIPRRMKKLRIKRGKVKMTPGRF